MHLPGPVFRVLFGRLEAVRVGSHSRLGRRDVRATHECELETIALGRQAAPRRVEESTTRRLTIRSAAAVLHNVGYLSIGSGGDQLGLGLG